MNTIEKKIIGSIDNFTDDILDFTRRLVAEPSILGDEASAMEVMEAELIRHFNKTLGLEEHGIGLNVKFVDSIPVGKSGKLLSVVSEVKQDS